MVCISTLERGNEKNLQPSTRERLQILMLDKVMAARKISQLERNGIAAVAMVILLFIYMTFISNPMEIQCKKAATKQARLFDEVEQLKGRLLNQNTRKAIRRLKQRVEQAEEKLEKAEIHLSKGSETETIANQILHIASASYLLLTEFQPVSESGSGTNSATDKNYFPRTHFKASLKGRFDSVVEFVKRTNMLPKLVTYETIDISKIPKKRLMKVEIMLLI